MNKRKNIIVMTTHDFGQHLYAYGAEKYPDVMAIAGVEISTHYLSRKIHIVGIFLDHTCENLQNFLKDIQLKRRQRNELMAQKLLHLIFMVLMNGRAGNVRAAGQNNF